MSILSMKDISKFYALDGKHKEQALRNINLQIAEGKSRRFMVRQAVAKPVY